MKKTGNTAWIRNCLTVLTALATLTAHAIDASPAEGESPVMNDEQAEQRWTSFLPMMKEEALARGHELPLPIGVSVVYNYLSRDVDVSDVRLSLNGGPPQSVSDFLDLGSNSKVNAALFKADAWLLPFMNVYVLGGYIYNESTSKGTVSIPRPGGLPPQQFDLTLPTTLDGFVGGGGITLAAGYQDFFLMLDLNYTQTDMGFDDSFRAMVASTRAGWNGAFGDVPTRLWLGGAYWDTENTARSSVDVIGLGSVGFEADQGPRHPWNLAVGGSVVLSKHWDAFLEYGFNFDDVNIIATGVTFRF